MNNMHNMQTGLTRGKHLATGEGVGGGGGGGGGGAGGAGGGRGKQRPYIIETMHSYTLPM